MKDNIELGLVVKKGKTIRALFALLPTILLTATLAVTGCSGYFYAGPTRPPLENANTEPYTTWVDGLGGAQGHYETITPFQGALSNTPTSIPFPVQGNLPSATKTKVAAGAYCTLAIKADGTLWGWGYYATGQLGNGKKGQTNIPEQIGSDNDWATISHQDWHTVALKTNGTLWAWGSDEYGQLGDGGSGYASDNTPLCRLAPVQIGKDNDWIAAYAGGKYTLALKSDSSLWAWGENDYGQLGDGRYRQSQSSHANDVREPTRIGTDNDWVKIFNLGGTSMAIKKDGTLWSWGENSGHQLGRSSGDYDYDPVPKQVGTDTDWVLVTTGYWHSIYGLKQNGTLWAWGLSVATDTDPLRRVQLSGNDWQWVSSKGEHVFAFSGSKGWFVWGNNSEGQLGLASATGLDQPTRFSGNDWQNIIAGFSYTIAVKTDGSLWAWGENGNGQLGLRHNNDVNTPTMVWK